MTAPAIHWLAWLAIAASPSAGELNVNERAPIALLLFMSQASPPSASWAEIFSAADGSLRRRTNFALSSESLSETECGGGRAFTCWALAIHARRPDARFLLVINAFADARQASKEDHLSAVLLDISEISLLDGQIEKGSEDRAERLEDLAFTRAVAEQRRPSRVADSGSLSQFFDALIDGDFKDLLARSIYVQPPSSLEVKAPAGLEILLDDNPIGATKGPVTRISGLAIGRRKLALRDDALGRDVMRTEVTVKCCEPNVLVASSSIASATAGEALPPHLVGRVVGTALATAGGAVLTYSLIAKPSYHVCTSDCPDSSPRLARFCDFTDSNGKCAGLGRALVAPLGVALIAAGATLFTEDELSDDLRWWAPLVALFAGLTAYGVGALSSH